jgi:hypothetical protein
LEKNAKWAVKRCWENGRRMDLVTEVFLDGFWELLIVILSFSMMKIGGRRSEVCRGVGVRR